MSWRDRSWSLTVWLPEPTQYNTTINNYYYGDNYVESEEYDEEWDDEDYDEEYDEEEDYDDDDEYDDEEDCEDDDYDDDDEYDDEEDCEDDDYEVTNRNTNLPAAAPAPVVINNNVKVNSRTYSRTTYGDINVFIQNNPRIIEAARNSASIARTVANVIDKVTNTNVLDDLEKCLGKAAASTIITGRKEAAAISLAADTIRNISKHFIG